jgi:hypothetical protein
MNNAWDYIIFALIMIGLVGIMVLLNRAEKRTKAKYKKTAYALLENGNPTEKELKDTIKGLRLYGGRFFKDKECIQLVDRLLTKWDMLDGK